MSPSNRSRIFPLASYVVNIDAARDGAGANGGTATRGHDRDLLATAAEGVAGAHKHLTAYGYTTKRFRRPLLRAGHGGICAHRRTAVKRACALVMHQPASTPTASAMTAPQRS